MFHSVCDANGISLTPLHCLDFKFLILTFEATYLPQAFECHKGEEEMNHQHEESLSTSSSSLSPPLTSPQSLSFPIVLFMKITNNSGSFPSTSSIFSSTSTPHQKPDFNHFLCVFFCRCLRHVSCIKSRGCESGRRWENTFFSDGLCIKSSFKNSFQIKANAQRYNFPLRILLHWCAQ